jgi:hypothetical protein
MEWENKVKMAQLGNRRNESNESKKEFQDLIFKLRKDGWQDWFIILTIMNFILNYILPVKYK